MATNPFSPPDYLSKIAIRPQDNVSIPLGVVDEKTDDLYTKVGVYDDETLHKLEQLSLGHEVEGTTQLNTCAAWELEDRRLYDLEEQTKKELGYRLVDALRAKGI
jgi:hypothetical protein